MGGEGGRSILSYWICIGAKLVEWYKTTSFEDPYPLVQSAETLQVE